MALSRWGGCKMDRSIGWMISSVSASKGEGHLMEKIRSEFLFNSKYELLLQQRSATKVTFPLVCTNTYCSHPLYRESELVEENFLGVQNAAQRKLLDELSISTVDVPIDQFTPLGCTLYKGLI